MKKFTEMFRKEQEASADGGSGGGFDSAATKPSPIVFFDDPASGQKPETSNNPALVISEVPAVAQKAVEPVSAEERVPETNMGNDNALAHEVQKVIEAFEVGKGEKPSEVKPTPITIPVKQYKDIDQEIATLSNADWFKKVSKALKQGQKFKINGIPVLSIATISPKKGIDVMYKNNTTGKGRFRPLTIRPDDIQGFLDYLEGTFGWKLKTKERRASKPKTEPKSKPEPKTERSHIRENTPPVDKDDAARAGQAEPPDNDYEDARSVERIAAGAVAKTGEGVDETLRPESKETASGEQAEEEEEWAFEALKDRLDQVEVDVLTGIVARGLMRALEFSRENKMTKAAVIESLGGIEEVANGLSQILIDVLPSGWNAEEKKQFSLRLTQERVAAFAAKQ